MEEKERQSSAKTTDTSGNASLIHDHVSDPEEDDLDDLDGMI